MIRRTFAIPTLGTLSLTLSTACSPDSLVGIWSLTEASLDGETYQLAYSYSYGGCTFSYSLTLDMEFEEGSSGTYDGKWTIGYNNTVQCEPSSPYFEKFLNYEPYSYSYSYKVTAQSNNKRDYTITLEDDDLVLSCVREDDDMTCNDVDDEGGVYLFER